MKTGYGVFFQCDNGRTICVVATDSYTRAQMLNSKLADFLRSRELFGTEPCAAKTTEDFELFEHFEKLEKKYGSQRILRNGIGEVLLAVKEA